MPHQWATRDDCVHGVRRWRGVAIDISVLRQRISVSGLAVRLEVVQVFFHGRECFVEDTWFQRDNRVTE